MGYPFLDNHHFYTDVSMGENVFDEESLLYLSNFHALLSHVHLS